MHYDEMENVVFHSSEEEEEEEEGMLAVQVAAGVWLSSVA